MNEDLAAALIKRCSRHLGVGSIGLSYYEEWVESEEEVAPGISNLLRDIAKANLSAIEELLVRSSVQALGCVGTVEDILSLQSLLDSSSDHIRTDVTAAIALIQYKSKTIETLLDEVVDQASFIAFARALAKQREAAVKIEAASPHLYCIDGALDWKNADISSFIYAGLAHFDRRPEASALSWQDLAGFLYMGKIHE
ncbi:hypothetical protein [Nevskia ramosa]|uniref:hypothetical protein n=1 Tax=Nevskia ramosa TaxID=64002 RepID=UPI003D1231DC